MHSAECRAPTLPPELAAQRNQRSPTFQIEGRSSGCQPVGVTTQLLPAAWLLLALLLISWLALLLPLLLLAAAQAGRVLCCPNCRCQLLPPRLPGLPGPGKSLLSVQDLLRLLLLHGIAVLPVLPVLAAAQQGSPGAATAAAAGGSAGGRHTACGKQPPALLLGAVVLDPKRMF